MALPHKPGILILMADDDEDDFLLVRDALRDRNSAERKVTVSIPNPDDSASTQKVPL